MRIFLIFLGIHLCMAPLFSASSHHKFYLAIASSLRRPLNDLLSLFENSYPEYRGQIHLISGQSGNLARQILMGAPYHIFISADPEHIIFFNEHQYDITLSPKKLEGTLMLWINPLKISPEEFLKPSSFSPSIRHIAYGNPLISPCALISERWLKKNHLLHHYKKIEYRLFSQAHHFAEHDMVLAIFFPTAEVVGTPLEKDCYFLSHTGLSDRNKISLSYPIFYIDPNLDQSPLYHFMNFIFLEKNQKLWSYYGFFKSPPEHIH